MRELWNRIDEKIALPQDKTEPRGRQDGSLRKTLVLPLRISAVVLLTALMPAGFVTAEVRNAGSVGNVGRRKAAVFPIVHLKRHELMV